jgi:hypothetical protein
MYPQTIELFSIQSLTEYTKLRSNFIFDTLRRNVSFVSSFFIQIILFGLENAMMDPSKDDLWFTNFRLISPTQKNILYLLIYFFLRQKDVFF